jgi:ATP-dependent DNA ligase
MICMDIRLIKPMKLHDTNGIELEDPNYLVERKWDGTRMQIHRFWENNRKTFEIKLYSARSIKCDNVIDYTSLYPNIVKELQKLEGEFILDAELVFVYKNKPESDSFLTCAAKQNTIENMGMVANLKIFDILYLNGEYLINLPIEERKKKLYSISFKFPGKKPKYEFIEIIQPIEEDKWGFYQDIIFNGGEGVVLKLRGSIYEEGIRSYLWRKIKHKKTGDYVAVGYTQGLNKRETTLGSIILGRWDKDLKRFVFSGHTSGFEDSELSEWRKYFDEQESFVDPFNNLEELKKADGIKFINPNTARVIEVQFLNKTNNNILRMPTFIRIRDDKTPIEAEG